MVLASSKKAIFLILSPTKYLENGLSTHYGYSTKTIQLLPAVRSTLKLLPVGWDAIFSTFGRMRTRSLVPKPKTTVIGLGVRLIASLPAQLYGWDGLFP